MPEIAVVYYSCHGDEMWGLTILGDNYNEINIFFKYIEKLWVDRKNMNLNYILIILDIWYSFIWIEKLRKSVHENIFILASV